MTVDEDLIGPSETGFPRLATVHVDLDGATHIYRAHGWGHAFRHDALFTSGFRRLLDCFRQRRITATLFVIAEDLADPAKRALILDAARQGHEIASHTMTHRPLTRLSPDERLAELRDSRDAIEQAVGKPVTGFRAPGFLVDRITLALAGEAGYRYDSSAFHGSRAPHGALALGDDVIGFEREVRLRELAMPRYDGMPWPFHPSYSQLLGTRYFSAGLHRALRSTSHPFVFLIHLTDLADPLPAADLQGWASRVYTLSVLSVRTKERRLARMLDMVAARCSLVATNSLLSADESRLSLQ
jgi:peptidoglycan/xylan/chitin deacetylase (PgdA/CDA1 family)